MACLQNVFTFPFKPKLWKLIFSSLFLFSFLFLFLLLKREMKTHFYRKSEIVFLSCFHYVSATANYKLSNLSHSSFLQQERKKSFNLSIKRKNSLELSSTFSLQEKEWENFYEPIRLENLYYAINKS